jgi:hypothetical protein
MSDLIPYLAVFVTILFALAFYWGLQEFKKMK